MRMRVPAAAAMVTADRVAFTIRMDRARYEALQRLYYQTAAIHRSSFNAWIVSMIHEGMTATWYAADCPPADAPPLPADHMARVAEFRTWKRSHAEEVPR